jgi:hypothetical protein
VELKSAASYSSLGGVVARGPIDHEHLCLSRTTALLFCSIVVSKTATSQTPDTAQSNSHTATTSTKHRRLKLLELGRFVQCQCRDRPPSLLRASPLPS